MYPEIWLNPDITDAKSVDELKEIVIDEWKAAHPNENAEIIRNLEDPTKAKLICEIISDYDIEGLKFDLTMEYPEEDLPYIDII